MATVESTRSHTALTGFVTDRATGRPLGGAEVEVIAGPPAFRTRLGIRERQHGAAWNGMATRLDRTTSAADGHFHLRDLPPGNYTLRAALPALGSRYGAMRVKLVVGADGSAGTGVSLSLPPTLVRGRVLGRGDEPVALAEVRLRGSGEKTFTDRDGRFVLAGVETGERTVEVSARGYPAARQTVRLPQPGWERTLEFRLAGDTP